MNHQFVVSPYLLYRLYFYIFTSCGQTGLFSGFPQMETVDNPQKYMSYPVAVNSILHFNVVVRFVVRIFMHIIQTRFIVLVLT